MTAFLTSGALAVRGSRLNPVTKIVALVVLSVPVLVTGNALMSAVLITGELVALPILGLGPRVVLRYAGPFVLVLSGIWLANYVAAHDVAILLPITARLVSLALPGLMLILTTEPVELADALVQLWRAPARFAYGALAAFRLLPLLGADWISLRRARRARGVRANPATMLFALLVTAIRRAVRLAAAMDARGFDSSGPRTFARPSRLRRIDWVSMAASVSLVVLAAAVAFG